MENGFKIFLGDQDITEQIMVRRISMDVGCDDMTVVNLQVYADCVEIIPHQANFHILPTEKPK